MGNRKKGDKELEKKGASRVSNLTLKNMYKVRIGNPKKGDKELEKGAIRVGSGSGSGTGSKTKKANMTSNSKVDMNPDEKGQVCKDINKKLDSLSLEISKYSIYRTHDHLRNVNGKAYKPEIIAIGPYHRGNRNTKMMEEHKLLYLQSLLKRKNENVEKYVSAIGEMEQEARQCYAERISLSSAKFTEMMVLDGCFIIELVRKCNMKYLREKNDPIFKRDWMMNSLLLDLMLFENQIPFSVLCRLFDLIEHPKRHKRLIYLVLRFFRDIFPGAGYRTSVDKNSDEIKHLLELIHVSWRPSLLDKLDFGKDAKDKKEGWEFVNSVTKLRDANIKFETKKGDSLFDVAFDKGSMKLPTLTVDDRTESFFRNLIAYEQFFPDPKCNFVQDYVKLFDCLVDCPGDVEILRNHKILDNWLGDNEGVSRIFNKLTDQVTFPGEHFIYAKIFESVDIHCKESWNKYRANLRENYFSSPWSIISVLVAFVLLLLTVIQTVCSILQVV